MSPFKELSLTKLKLTLQYLYCELEFLTDKKRKQKIEREILKLKNILFIVEHHSENGNNQITSLFFKEIDSPVNKNIFTKKENRKEPRSSKIHFNFTP